MSNSAVVVVALVDLDSVTNGTQVIELTSLGFMEVRDNLMCCEALCFGEMETVE